MNANDNNPLMGVRWVLVTLNSETVTVAEERGRQPYLEFAEEDRYYGNAGCNQINGGYEWKGDSLNFALGASTMMACPSMEVEDAFNQMLSQVTNYRIQGESLELFSGDKLIATFDATPIYELTGVKWELKTLNDETPDFANLRQVPYLEFTAEGQRVSGFTGCNRARGVFERDGNKLHFGPIAGTKMACPDLTLEDAFTKALQEVTHFRIDGNRLMLTKNGKTVATFIAAAE